MTPLFRTPRLVVLAASTAMAAAGLLAPASAFASTAPTDHVTAMVPKGDGDDPGNHSTLLHTTKRGDPDAIRTDSDSFEPADREHHAGLGWDDDIGLTQRPTPNKPQWQCFAAPCETPGDVAEPPASGDIRYDPGPLNTV
ncbi:hypothetical protein ABTX80_31475 [Streptomyces erythrochromogenes]|uniref:hypothetical protein n=1 Tax=Streptomyces erythrochromogenes TaxID=285574 RepID=UPI00331BF9C0